MNFQVAQYDIEENTAEGIDEFDVPTLSGLASVNLEVEIAYEHMMAAETCEMCQHTEMCLMHDTQE